MFECLGQEVLVFIRKGVISSKGIVMSICNSHELQGCKLGHLKGFRNIDQDIMATVMRFGSSSKYQFTYTHPYSLSGPGQLYRHTLASLTMSGHG